MKIASKFAIKAFSVVVAAPLCAWAAGGGSVGGGDMPAGREMTPQEIARAAYNDGVRAVKQATKYEADIAKQTRDDKKAKAVEKTRKQYDKARAYFARAVTQQPKMHEAWNYVGYTSRKLGDAATALGAYDEALKLKPDYAEAIEYRAVAYLALNRLDDAKNAYMTLFRDNRKLADQLMLEMRAWVTARRADPAGIATAQLDSFDQWVTERANIAQQTASLAIDAPTAWR
jgi:tetratricopeptide (TPR) repeat protein